MKRKFYDKKYLILEEKKKKITYINKTDNKNVKNICKKNK